MTNSFAIHLTISDDLSVSASFQDPSSENSYSTFRRTLNALRHRLARKRPRPPDKAPGVDKFTVANQAPSQQSGNPTDGVYSRLSFDPSLPSYYRVSQPWISIIETRGDFLVRKLKNFFSAKFYKFKNLQNLINLRSIQFEIRLKTE